MDELKKLRLALVHEVQVRWLMGREKRNDKTDVDKRTNGKVKLSKHGNVRQATIGNENKNVIGKVRRGKSRAKV